MDWVNKVLSREKRFILSNSFLRFCKKFHTAVCPTASRWENCRENDSHTAKNVVRLALSPLYKTSLQKMHLRKRVDLAAHL